MGTLYYLYKTSCSHGEQSIIYIKQAVLMGNSVFYIEQAVLMRSYYLLLCLIYIEQTVDIEYMWIHLIINDLKLEFNRV